MRRWNKLLKTLHFKSICPTQACTTPPPLRPGPHSTLRTGGVEAKQNSLYTPTVCEELTRCAYAKGYTRGHHPRRIVSSRVLADKNVLNEGAHGVMVGMMVGVCWPLYQACR